VADSKISALAAASAVADANEFAINEAGTSKKVTGLQNKTHANTAPVFAAGTASANTWPKLTSGTILTTAEVGAVELDATNLYATTDAGNRGYVPVHHFIRRDATFTLTSSTSRQKLFDSPTNGALTLETGCYLFDSMIRVSAMSATAGNAAIDILGAGTAVAAAWLWLGVGTENQTVTQQSGTWNIAAASPAAVVTAATGTTLHVRCTGTFEITTAGTVIPSITLLTAAAAVVDVGTYFQCERIGSTTVVSVGQWS